MMKVYFICGEPSGDLLASGLMKALKLKTDNISFMGVGGESMTSMGLNSLFDMSELTVMGFFEVIPRLPLILKRLKEIVDDIKRNKPDIIVTVDSWGFVSALLKKLKKENITIPKLHYVAPQVWAWKKGRAKKVAQIVDRLMTLLPNEPQYFEKYGLKCDFVGHPVTENIAPFTENEEKDFAMSLGIPENATIVTVLPGSRKSEAGKLIPVFKKAVEIISKEYTNTYVILPTVVALDGEIKKKFNDLKVPFIQVYGRENRLKAFRLSKVAIAASGTVSLELAVCKTPHLIAYTFNPITNILARIFVKLKFVNLINILANKEIIPEFLLHNCKADLIANKAKQLLSNQQATKQQIDEAQQSLNKLKLPHILPSDRCAEIVIEMIKN